MQVYQQFDVVIMFPSSNLSKSETLVQVFFGEFCEFFSL